MSQKSALGMSARPSQSAEKISWDQWYEALQQWTLEKSGYVAPQDQVSMTAWVRDEMNRNAGEVAKSLRRLYAEKVQQLQKWNWLFRFLYDVSALEREVAQVNDVVAP